MSSEADFEHPFGRATIDCDEWRDVPIRHRYVHGFFAKTIDRFIGPPGQAPCHVTFSIYLPSAEAYRGRFLNHIEGGWGGHDNLVITTPLLLRFAIEECGAYVVESNLGHAFPNLPPEDLDIHHYTGNEAAARYAIQVATRMYGAKPHHGYVFGRSGGGIRTITALEQVRDLWDGGVAIVPGINTEDYYVFQTMSAWANLIRVLGAKLPEVVDAYEPGGSGDPFPRLDENQAAALRTALRYGIVPESLFQLLRPFDRMLAPFLMSFPATWDPQYVSDFWSVAGYAGADGELNDALIEQTVKITAVLSAEQMGLPSNGTAGENTGVIPIGIVFEGLRDLSNVQYASLNPVDGIFEHPLTVIAPYDRALLCLALSPDTVKRLKPGFELRISNRQFLSWCLFHRYLPRWDLPNPDGHPKRTAYQRSVGLPMTGKFAGKLIVAPSEWDILAPASGSFRYMDLVKAAGNSNRARLWYSANSVHGTASDGVPPGPVPVLSARTADYTGHYQQAIVDLIDWVEKGVEPSPSTSYSYVDGARCLPTAAVERRGIQPVVTASANGASCATVAAGAPVTLRATAEAPPGTGTIIDVAWDFDGTGTWPCRHDIDGSSAKIDISATHIYSSPGTYFPAVRVHSHRAGKRGAELCAVENIARVRVVVTG